MNDQKEFLTLQNFRNKSDQGKHIQAEIALNAFWNAQEFGELNNRLQRSPSFESKALITRRTGETLPVPLEFCFSVSPLQSYGPQLYGATASLTLICVFSTQQNHHAISLPLMASPALSTSHFILHTHAVTLEQNNYIHWFYSVCVILLYLLFPPMS